MYLTIQDIQYWMNEIDEISKVINNIESELESKKKKRSFSNIFSKFFTPNDDESEVKKSKKISTVYNLELSLEQLYSGCTKKLRITRTIQDKSGYISNDSKILNVKIDPGCNDGERIVYENEGNVLNGVPSDIVVNIKEKKHPNFIRDGNDLIFNYLISTLSIPSSISIPFLDGSSIPFRINKNNFNFDQVYIIKDKGMPIKDKSDTFGDLIVRFQSNL